MLTSYKKISIIYGGSGRKYASAIRERLQLLHKNEFYPIKVDDLNTDWVGHNILDTVINTIKDSDLIYIIFTLDDVGASKSAYNQNKEKSLVGRLRQNVLIELGMALVVVGHNTEKIKVIADFAKSELGDDFPSDIRNAFSIREFSPDTFEEVVESTCDFVRNEFEITPTKGLLHDENAVVDFENVFDEFESLNLYRDTKIKCLNDILDLWLPILNSFDYVEERLMYALERLKSFPVFGSGKQLIAWIRTFRSACLDTHLEAIDDRRFVQFVQETVNACLEYTIIKTDPEIERDIDAYKAVADDFEDLYNEYQDLCAKNVKMHPLIRFVLLEYYGLTLMRIYTLSPNKAMLAQIISLYEESVPVAQGMDTHFKLFQGYVTFNLGRAHYYRFQNDGNDADAAAFHNLMEKTIRIRNKWKNYDGFLDCYLNALSYEYFYALSEYIKMQKFTGELSGETFSDRLSKLISDIDEYICKDSELKKLYIIKCKCLEMYAN